MGRAGAAFNVQLHQALGGKADHLAKIIGVGVFSKSACTAILSSVIVGSSVALMFATQPYRRISDDRRKPLARYGAIEGALRERLAPLLHHQWGHDHECAQFALWSGRAVLGQGDLYR
jgi:hypothetical protein